MNKSPEWLFEDPPNVATITTKGILEKQDPILFVTHDADDGMWQFLPGFEVDEDDSKVVSLASVIKIDPSLHELHDLPLGWTAERDSLDDPWRRFSDEDDEDFEDDE